MPVLSVKNQTAGEGDGFVDFVVALDAAAAQAVSVDYGTVDSTADRFGDYTSTSGRLTFAPGETSKAVRVPLLNGTSAEGFESFYLRLSAPVNATIATPYAMAHVIDNDHVVATPQLFVRDVVVDEKQGTATFAVTLGNVLGQASNASVSVGFATVDGSAVAGSDYVARSGTLTFAAGDVVKHVVVSLADDATAESVERFGLALSSPVNATIGDGFASAEIGASDATAVAQPRISIGDATVGEGDGWVDLVVGLSAPGQNTVTVVYGTLDSTADRFGDYVGTGSTLSFAPGETVKVVRVELRDGTAAEGVESFSMLLSAAANAVIAKPSARIDVVDNDTVVDTPQLFVRDVVVDEKQGTATFVVTLGNVAGRASNSVVTVDYTTVDDTAFTGVDYQQRSGTLTFAPGEVAKTVVVDLIDDNVAEGLDRFGLSLANAVNASIGDGFARAEIAPNDATATSQPRIAVADAIVGEGDGHVDLVVSLSAPGQSTVTVDYGTVDSTADRFGDYVGTGSTLSFAPGETVKVVRVELRDGLTAEDSEAFHLRLSSATNAVIARPDARVDVVDNDAVVDTPQLFVRDVVVDEKQGTATFAVTLGNLDGRASNSTVSVDYTTADGTASSAADFVGRSGTLSFAPGEVVKRVVVDITDDAAAEGFERFGLLLSNAVNAAIGDGAALALIGASDATAVSQPRITVGDATVGEGDGHVDLVVSLSAPGQNTVTVDYDTVDSTADRFGDYVGTGSTLSFAPGETVKVVRVELRDGLTAEDFESFRLQLSSATNAVIARPHARIDVIDNDAVVDTPRLFVRDVVVDEKQGTATFAVTLGQSTGQSSNSAVRVHYATVPGTALAGQDYEPTNGTLVFAPGESAKTVVVDLVDDAWREGVERFGLLLSDAVNATLGDAVASARIGASDTAAAAQPTIAIEGRQVAEGDGYVELAVALSAPSQSVVSVDYGTGDGSADRFGDYVGSSSTLTFAPGETTKSVRIELRDGGTVEALESFVVGLSRPVNAALGNTTATVQIVDDDGSGVAVLSHGAGDDVYVLSAATDIVVESAGGGSDTVVAPFSHALGPALENLVLAPGASSGTGNELNNVLRGNAAHNTLDGGAGIDTAVFVGPIAAYGIAGSAAARTVSGGADGSDTLLSIERLQFADQVLAYDSGPGGNAYAAYAMLYAILDAAPSPQMLGQWTAQLDQLGSTRDLAQAMINFYAPTVTDDVLAAYLWGTIIETPPTAGDIANVVALLAGGAFTQASLIEFVAAHPVNTNEFAAIVGQPIVMDASYFAVPG